MKIHLPFFKVCNFLMNLVAGARFTGHPDHVRIFGKSCPCMHVHDHVMCVGVYV